jgi:DNA-binding transcriptional ArsR family regulator
MKRATDPDVLLLQGAADPSRLAILRQLAKSDSVCACDFTDVVDRHVRRSYSQSAPHPPSIGRS